MKKISNILRSRLRSAIKQIVWISLR